MRLSSCYSIAPWRYHFTSLQMSRRVCRSLVWFHGYIIGAWLQAISWNAITTRFCGSIHCDKYLFFRDKNGNDRGVGKNARNTGNLGPGQPYTSTHWLTQTTPNNQNVAIATGNQNNPSQINCNKSHQKKHSKITAKLYPNYIQKPPAPTKTLTTTQLSIAIHHPSIYLPTVHPNQPTTKQFSKHQIVTITTIKLQQSSTTITPYQQHPITPHNPTAL